MIIVQTKIDHSVNLYQIRYNITATLSALFSLIKGVLQMTLVPYTKPPLSFAAQTSRLEQKGMLFNHKPHIIKKHGRLNYNYVASLVKYSQALISLLTVADVANLGVMYHHINTTHLLQRYFNNASLRRKDRLMGGVFNSGIGKVR